MNWFDLVQWPAMAVTVMAAGMVASKRTLEEAERRVLAVRAEQCFWTLWAIHDRAYAVVLLKVCLATLNIRGIYNNRSSVPK